MTLTERSLFSLAETLLDDFLLTYPVFMSTSDLCQALLGQYPYRNTEIVFNLSLSSGSSDHHQHWFHSCSISIITWAACWGLNPRLHLLYQALQGEGGWEGGPGEETQGPVPGVAMDGAVQRLPAWRRARQALHEGKRLGVAPKKFGKTERRDAQSENGCFLPDSVQLRAGWPLWAPGPGKGCEGAAESVHAASPTVSDRAALLLRPRQPPDADSNT